MSLTPQRLVHRDGQFCPMHSAGTHGDTMPPIQQSRCCTSPSPDTQLLWPSITTFSERDVIDISIAYYCTQIMISTFAPPSLNNSLRLNYLAVVFILIRECFFKKILLMAYQYFAKPQQMWRICATTTDPHPWNARTQLIYARDFPPPHPWLFPRKDTAHDISIFH